jgi:hypothetical protein
MMNLKRHSGESISVATILVSAWRNWRRQPKTCQYNWCLGRDSKRGSLEYKYRALPLCQPAPYCPFPRKISNLTRSPYYLCVYVRLCVPSFNFWTSFLTFTKLDVNVTGRVWKPHGRRYFYAGSEDLTAVLVATFVVWDTTPCSPFKVRSEFC